MDLHTSRKGSSVLALALSLAAVGSGAALAQEEAAGSREQRIEEIVVTGSRISRESVFETLTPTVAISGAELDKRSVTNVVDALNEIPGFVLSQSSAGNQNDLSIGVSYANMYGLGSQRTLTLVDGRRVVSSNPPQIQGLAGGSQVDLNLIPLALIERIETVGVGGAPTYGSDAIAGTVNIIMKDDYEGFELTGQYDFIENNGGEPENYMIQAAWGTNTSDGRGNVSVGLEYNRDKGVLVDDFPRIFGPQPSFHEIPAARDVDGDGTLEDVNRMFYDVRIPVQTNGPGAVLTPTGTFLPFGPPFGITQAEADALSMFPGADSLLQITADGRLTEYHPGTGIPSDPFAAVGGDGLDRDLRNQLISPVERVTGMVTAHYEILPAVEVYGQANFADTEARTLASQDALNIFPFSDENAALGFSIDTPFISDADRQVLIDAGAGDTFFAGVAPESVVDNGKARSDTSLWRVVTGLRGDFELAERGFHWDASVNFGQSTVTSRDVGFNDGRFFNAIDAIRLTDADIQSVVDADNGIDTAEAALQELSRISGTTGVASSDVVCRVVLQAARGEIPRRGSPGGGASNDVLPDVDGCIPLNVLSTPGPDEAIAWVQRQQITRGHLEQRVVNLSMNGELVELPAGWIDAVVGYEGRHESGGFEADEATQIGIGRNSPILDTEGEYSTDEVFVELLAPIIGSDMQLGEETLGFTPIDTFTLEGSARTVDHSITGRDDVWTIGGRLRFGGVLSDLMFRGNVTESTRSPSIQELFSPRVDTFAFADDPCDVRFRQEGPAPANRQANCEAAGLPANFSALVVRAAQEGVTGGNPGLDVERADAWSFGAVYTPLWLPELTLSADYINIEIKDRITTLTLEDQMQACFDQDPSSFDPDAGVCASFQRDAQGQIAGFATGFQNAALSSFKGIQMLAQYRFDLADALGVFNDGWAEASWGSIDVSARAFRRIENEFSVIGEEPEETIGGFDEPTWSGTFDVTWTTGPAQVYWRLKWQDAAELDPQGDEYFEDQNGHLVSDTGARFINDLGLTWSFFDELTAQLTIDNVLDRKASDLEIAASRASDVNVAFGHLGLDEIFGRTFKVRLTARF